jgi:hypothetical protein
MIKNTKQRNSRQQLVNYDHGLLQALTDVQNHSIIPTPETREKSIQHLQLPNNIIPVWRPGPAYRIPNPIPIY